jgi:hypothetical protein
VSLSISGFDHALEVAIRIEELDFKAEKQGVRVKPR